MIRSTWLVAAFVAVCLAVLCDPFAGEALAGPKSRVRKDIRHKAHHLARKDWHLKRDIHRDQRHEKHVKAHLGNLRKWLHNHRVSKK